MPVHSRVTTINAFATGKTDRVPMESNYVEDYFDVQTFTRGLTNNGAQKVTTYVDLSQAEDEGMIWHKFTGDTGDYQVVTKLTPSKQIVANGQTIGIGSEQIILNNNPQLAAISNVTLDAGGGNGAAVDFETHNDGYVVHSTDFAKQSVGNDDQLDLNLSVQFKKKKKFFDVQTWTGDGVYGKEIFHDLDCEPGFIMIKRLDANDDWFAYHKYSDPTAPERYWYYALMDAQARKWVSNSVYALKPNGTKSVLLTNTTANSSAGQYTNYNGAPYIGYFFADKGSGGFGDDGTEDAIACGVGVVRADRFAADAFNECGFEPDLVLVRNKTETDYWRLINTSSGWFDNFYENIGGTTRAKSPFFNTTSQAGQTSWMRISNEANGFWIENGTGSGMGEGDEFIWIAVRKPQKTAEQYNLAHSGVGGTSFFQAFKGSGINRTPREQPGFTPDMAFYKGGLFSGSTVNPWVQFKSMGTQVGNGIEDGQIYGTLRSNSNIPVEIDPAGGGANNYNIGIIEKGYIVHSDGSYTTDANTGMYVFRKARGFFDDISWTYNNVGVQTVRHSLGVKPEFMVVKALRDSDVDYSKWKIYHAGIGATMGATIGASEVVSAFAAQTWWNNTEPTASEIFTGPGISNGSSIAGGNGLRAFMFSSVEGICKVGVYTGTNQAIDVNCGFSSAPRFIMIKNANTTDSFYIWDNMQGMSISPANAGDQLWGNPGDYTWTCPAGITKASVVLVGGGGGGSQGAHGFGGGGGALAYKNNITVVPGTTYNITVGVGGTYGGTYAVEGGDGGNSTITIGSETYMAYGGKGGVSPSGPAGAGGTCSANTDNSGIGTASGNGGRGGWNAGSNAGGGGGGAGGYSGNGGAGGYSGTSTGSGTQTGGDGNGGAAGGGAAGVGGNRLGGGGGGTGLYGEGASGSGGSSTSGDGSGGTGGSVSNTLTPPGPNNNVGGGRDGTQSWSNGHESDAYFGGGGAAQGGSSNSMTGAKGGVRIIWGENSAGVARTFPDPANAGSLFDPYWIWNKDWPQQTGKDYIGVSTSGFGVAGGAPADINDSGSKYIYLAIA